MAQALDDPRLDAMVIAAPAPAHAALCRLALDHGKDVFVEKPLASDLAEAEDLAAHVARSDRVFMIGHLLRHHPAFEALSAIVARGEIGPLRYITASRLSLGRVRTHENAFLSLSPHDVSIILALAGAAPIGVEATGRAFVTPGVADEVHADLAFPGGLHAHIAASWLSPFKEQKLVVVGDRGPGVRRRPPVARKADAARPGRDPDRCGADGRGRRTALRRSGRRAAPDQRNPPLRPVLPDQSSPLTGIDEGVRVQRVLEQVQNAISTRQDRQRT